MTTATKTKLTPRQRIIMEKMAADGPLFIEAYNVSTTKLLTDRGLVRPVGHSSIRGLFEITESGRKMILTES